MTKYLNHPKKLIKNMKLKIMKSEIKIKDICTNIPNSKIFIKDEISCVKINYKNKKQCIT